MPRAVADSADATVDGGSLVGARSEPCGADGIVESSVSTWAEPFESSKCDSCTSLSSGCSVSGSTGVAQQHAWAVGLAGGVEWS